LDDLFSQSPSKLQCSKPNTPVTVTAEAGRYGVLVMSKIERQKTAKKRCKSSPRAPFTSQKML
jgi:topoisomerase IA-like protein